MFAQIGAALTGVAAKRRRTPVHRNSRAAGKCELSIWKPTNRQNVRQIVLAARRYEISMKQHGARNGPLGNVAIELLELMANMVDYRTGRLEPSIDTMMRKLRRSRDAIVRGLKALRTHGFLDWLRRYVPSGNEGRGPQVKQTSNAYRLSLPARAKAFLGRYGTTPPLPEDRAQAIAERAEMIEAHRATLEPAQKALFELGDTPIGNALARLGNLLKQRESVQRTESRSDSIHRKE